MTIEIKNLAGAVLMSIDAANLRGADLRGANLRGADLRGAYLCSADLRGAYLCDANLRAANLRGADLRGADLRGAAICGGHDSRGYRFVGVEDDGGEIMIAAGCRWFALEEARAHWSDDRPTSPECLARVELIASIHEARQAV